MSKPKDCASTLISLVILATSGGVAVAESSPGATRSPEEIAGQLREALLADCPTGSEELMLSAIADGTQGTDVSAIAAALAILRAQEGYCANAQAAIASASEAAVLATRAGTTSTGDVGGSRDSTAFVAPFSVPDGGVPGGGGGSGYSG